MHHRRAMLATATLAVATGLTLRTAGALDLLERPVRDTPPLAWLLPRRPETDPAGDAAVVRVPVPDPVPRTPPGPAPGPAPLVRTAAPVVLHLPTLAVSAPVLPVGVLDDGSMEVPGDVTTVGWYATSARRVSPGDPGTAVIVGHRDSRLAGPGALHDLALLGPGDEVQVVHLDGRVSTWHVEVVLTTPRDRLPGELLYAREGGPRLALVTCGGEFDRSTRSYRDNVIVVAAPTPGQARSR